MTPFSVTQCEKSWKTPYRHKMTYMDIKQILWRGRARFDFYSQGLSGIKTKWRLAVITAMLIAVPATTALNPCRGKLPLHLFTACGKNNKTSICASKQDFFFNPNTAAIQKLLLPLLLSLHFLDPTSHPSQGHVHPVACWPCFFPFRVLDFFFFLSVDSGSASAARGAKWWWTRLSLISHLAGKAALETLMSAVTHCSRWLVSGCDPVTAILLIFMFKDIIWNIPGLETERDRYNLDILLSCVLKSPEMMMFKPSVVSFKVMIIQLCTCISAFRRVSASFSSLFWI